MNAYYIARHGQQTGPFPETEVQQRIQSGDISASDMCWREGIADWQPVSSVFTLSAAPPPLPGVTAASAKADTPFLYISTNRLIVMSILSFNLYEAYWIYKNWRYVKERDNLNIKPFWRGIFGFFYCYGLLRRIHEDAQARAVQAPAFSPGRLATGWVILMVLANAIDRVPAMAASAISAFIPSFLFLVPVQNYINAVCSRQSPNGAYYKWSSGHIVCLVIGIIFWALILLGAVAES